RPVRHGMSERVPLRVVVPMKPVASWKRRLAKDVPDCTRDALVLLMLDHTVRTVTAALGQRACWVIGGDAYIERLTEEAGGAGLDLRPALGHSSYNRHRLAAEGAGSTLVPAVAAGLAFDLDSPGDLIYAKKNIPGFGETLARWEDRVRRDGHLIHPPSQWQDA